MKALSGRNEWMSDLLATDVNAMQSVARDSKGEKGMPCVCETSMSSVALTAFPSGERELVSLSPIREERAIISPPLSSFPPERK
jgi:hypothetical protein